MDDQQQVGNPGNPQGQWPAPVTATPPPSNDFFGWSEEVFDNDQLLQVKVEGDQPSSPDISSPMQDPGELTWDPLSHDEEDIPQDKPQVSFNPIEDMGPANTSEPEIDTNFHLDLSDGDDKIESPTPETVDISSSAQDQSTPPQEMPQPAQPEEPVEETQPEEQAEQAEETPVDEVITPEDVWPLPDDEPTPDETIDEEVQPEAQVQEEPQDQEETEETTEETTQQIAPEEQVQEDSSPDTDVNMQEEISPTNPNEIVAKFLELYASTQEMTNFKQATSGFDVLWADNDKVRVMYNFFVGDENYPLLLITKTETDKDTEEETVHELNFYLNEEKTALNINLDDIILFSQEDDEPRDVKTQMQVTDKINKFQFLLNEEIRKIQKEKREQEAQDQERKKLQDVFRNF